MRSSRRSRFRRRAFLLLAAGLPLAVLASRLPVPAADPRAGLQEALEAMRLPFAPARLDLVRFDHARQDGGSRVTAVIRLTWAPGTRQRGFSARGRTPEEAVALLADRVEATFSALA